MYDGDIPQNIDITPLGFSITADELSDKVKSYMGSVTLAGWSNLSSTISSLKATPELRWANPVELKNAVEKAFTAAFGEKTAIKAKGNVRLTTHQISKAYINIFLHSIGTQAQKDHDPGE